MERTYYSFCCIDVSSFAVIFFQLSGKLHHHPKIESCQCAEGITVISLSLEFFLSVFFIWVELFYANECCQPF